MTGGVAPTEKRTRSISVLNARVCVLSLTAVSGLTLSANTDRVYFGKDQKNWRIFPSSSVRKHESPRLCRWKGLGSLCRLLHPTTPYKSSGRLVRLRHPKRRLWFPHLSSSSSLKEPVSDTTQEIPSLSLFTDDQPPCWGPTAHQDLLQIKNLRPLIHCDFECFVSTEKQRK